MLLSASKALTGSKTSRKTSANRECQTRASPRLTQTTGAYQAETDHFIGIYK
jgi:hypothetical protein